MAEKVFKLKDCYLIFDFWAEKKLENEVILLARCSRAEPSRVLNKWIASYEVSSKDIIYSILMQAINDDSEVLEITYHDIERSLCMC